MCKSQAATPRTRSTFGCPQNIILGRGKKTHTQQKNRKKKEKPERWWDVVSSFIWNEGGEQEAALHTLIPQFIILQREPAPPIPPAQHQGRILASVTHPRSVFFCLPTQTLFFSHCYIQLCFLKELLPLSTPIPSSCCYPACLLHIDALQSPHPCLTKRHCWFAWVLGRGLAFSPGSALVLPQIAMFQTQGPPCASYEPRFSSCLAGEGKGPKPSTLLQ